MLVLPLYLLTYLEALILPVNVTCTRYCSGIVCALLWCLPMTYASEQAVNPPLGMVVWFHFSD